MVSHVTACVTDGLLSRSRSYRMQASLYLFALNFDLPVPGMGGDVNSGGSGRFYHQTGLDFTLIAN